MGCCHPELAGISGLGREAAQLAGPELPDQDEGGGVFVLGGGGVGVSLLAGRYLGSGGSCMEVWAAVCHARAGVWGDAAQRLQRLQVGCSRGMHGAGVVDGALVWLAVTSITPLLQPVGQRVAGCFAVPGTQYR
jgi:hypothetical protein